MSVQTPVLCPLPQHLGDGSSSAKPQPSCTQCYSFQPTRTAGTSVGRAMVVMLGAVASAHQARRGYGVVAISTIPVREVEAQATLSSMTTTGKHQAHNPHRLLIYCKISPHCRVTSMRVQRPHPRATLKHCGVTRKPWVQSRMRQKVRN